MQMSELTRQQLLKVFPMETRSSNVNFLTHVHNAGDSPGLKIAPIRQTLEYNFALPNLKRIVVGFDTKTTDNTLDILKEYKKKSKVDFHIFYDELNHHYGYFKNRCIAEARRCGMKDNEWAKFRGDDFFEDIKFIKRYHAFTMNPENVIGRIYVPEYHPWKKYITPTLKDFFPFLYEVARDRTLDGRVFPEMEFSPLEFVHEDFYKSFNRMTHGGQYFIKHHGLDLIGTVWHMGKHIDSLELAKYKIYKYATYFYFSWVAGTYIGTCASYEELFKKVQEHIANCSPNKEAMLRMSWQEFGDYLIEDYMTNGLPEGLKEYYDRLYNSARYQPIYG